MTRFLRWAGGLVVLLGIGIFLVFWLSPWPAAYLISLAFARGDAASEAALAKHVPAGIAERRDLAYGPATAERFDIFYPAGTKTQRPAIVWVHGGGWIAGSKEGVSNYLKVLAGHGYTAVALEYSMGPESKYPEPVREVNEALGYLVHNAAALHIDPGALVLAGDSAGAQIGAQTAILNTDAGYARRLGIKPALAPDGIRAVMLLSGFYDAGAVDFRGDWGWLFRTILWAYSGVKNLPRDEQFKLLSVTDYVTPAFPRTFISSGNGDPLAPQAVALTRKLEGLGVGVDSLFFPAAYAPALRHEYQFNLDTAGGRLVLTRMLAFLAATLKTRRSPPAAAMRHAKFLGPSGALRTAT
ncbi:MAG: alpha/beta hydrolase [Rhizomicrobium sp.]